MSIIAGARRFLREQEARYRASLSEAFAFKVAEMLNFINEFQYDTKDFFLNFKYSIFDNEVGIDGLYEFPFDVEIFKVVMFNNIAGSGGETELDIKLQEESGGSYESIFQTTPKIESAAGNWVRIGTGNSRANMTAPIFTDGAGGTSDTFNADAGDAIRIDCLSVQSGSPENCGLIVYFRPR